jgi:FkbM family methyltransferase
VVVQVFPYGLAEEEKACLVVSDSINVADGHVICNEEQLERYKGEVSGRGTVHTVRLGDYMSGVDVDVVKIDVEGYEPHVLAGAGV